MLDEKNGMFSIEFGVLESQPSAMMIAAGCSNNSNYFTSGGQRATCCCSCDKAIAMKTV